MSSSELVRVTTVVDASPAVAFEIFTQEIGSWWRTEPRYQLWRGHTGTPKFTGDGEERALVTADATTGETFLVGRVLAWEPGKRLAFEWRTSEFEASQITEVEVEFSPAGEGTRITLEHRGWDLIPANQPVRHGYTGEAFASMMGLWWGDLLVAVKSLSKKASAG